MSNWTQLEQMKSFIQENWKNSGFTSPTEVQQQAVSLILAGNDVIAESPTGTGKTLAYLLPILEKIDETKQGLQAIILVPSHELAMQILDEVRKFTKGTNITATSIIGGANVKKQVEKLKQRPQIVIGTTGRIVELIKLKKIKMHEVRTVVVDEADQLVAKEHLVHVDTIIKSTLKERQLLFFSATMTKETVEIAKQRMKNPEIIRVIMKQLETKTDHYYIRCDQREKVDVLRKLMHIDLGRTIAFLKNIEKVEEAEEKLSYHGYELAVLAGEGKKLERQQAMRKFRSGDIPLLITTDVAARGLDIEDIATVIHVDFPSTTNQYLHRSGRTGRMGKQGTVISLVNAREESFLQKMYKELNIPLKRKKLYKGKLIEEK